MELTTFKPQRAHEHRSNIKSYGQVLQQI